MKLEPYWLFFSYKVNIGKTVKNFKKIPNLPTLCKLGINRKNKFLKK